MQKKSQKQNVFYGVVGLIIIAYIYLSFNAPVNPNALPEFTLTGFTKYLVQITFVLPIALSWILGAVTVWRGWNFSEESNEESTGKTFKYLSLGLGILLLGFVVGSMIGQVRTYNPTDADIAKAVTITVNYVYVLSQFFGFWFLYKGASAGRQGKFLGANNKDAFVGAVLALVIGIFWVGLIFSNPTRQIANGLIAPSFYISDPLIVLTIIIPTLLGWFFGIIASFRLGDLAVTAAAAAADITLQKIFSKLVTGVWFLILGFIVLLGILSVGGERLISLGLAGLLAIIYVFVLLILLAYWRTAGAIKALYKNPQLVAHEHSQ